jgi:hypothetical protein
MYCYVGPSLLEPGAVVTYAAVEARKDSATSAITVDSATVEKLVHLALPVRLIHNQNGERGVFEMACTYDIHPRGARLRSTLDLKVGDLVTVERGRTKSVCQVLWAADPKSILRGQFTVECVDGARTPWEEELRLMDEQYFPLIPGNQQKKTALNAFRRGEQNRRRRPRYLVSGGANVAQIGGTSRAEGRLEQISEYGCLLSAGEVFAPGTELRLTLNMCDVSLAFRGHVRYTSENQAMGVEFQEIRQGDRPLLDYVLKKLRNPRSADFADLEVITEAVAAAG